MVMSLDDQHQPSSQSAATDLLADNQSTMPYNRTLLTELNDEMALLLLPAIIFLAVLMLVGSVGNFLTIYIYGWRLKPTTQNCLFMWLGVFDLMSCTVGMPSEIVDLRQYFLYENAVACKVMRFLSTIPTVASVNMLIIIAVDRYRRVCKPLHSQMELVHARIGIVVIVVVAVILAAPALSLYGQRTVKTSVEGLNGCDCSVEDKYLGRLYPLLYELIFGAIFVVYTTILSVLYTRVWLETRRHRQYMESHALSMTYASLLNLNTDDGSGNIDSPANSRRNSAVATADITVKIRKSLKANKVTVVAFVVTVVFVISYLPHLVLIILRTVVDGLDHRLTGAKLVLFHIFVRSFFVNSVADVFVYSAMNSDFREQCKQLCTCVRRRRRGGGGRRERERTRERKGSEEPV